MSTGAQLHATMETALCCGMMECGETRCREPFTARHSAAATVAQGLRTRRQPRRASPAVNSTPNRIRPNTSANPLSLHHTHHTPSTYSLSPAPSQEPISSASIRSKTGVRSRKDQGTSRTRWKGGTQPLLLQARTERHLTTLAVLCPFIQTSVGCLFVR